MQRLSLGQKRLIAIEENAKTNQRMRDAGFDVRTFPGIGDLHQRRGRADVPDAAAAAEVGGGTNEPTTIRPTTAAPPKPIPSPAW